MGEWHLIEMAAMLIYGRNICLYRPLKSNLEPKNDFDINHFGYPKFCFWISLIQILDIQYSALFMDIPKIELWISQNWIMDIQYSANSIYGYPKINFWLSINYFCISINILWYHWYKKILLYTSIYAEGYIVFVFLFVRSFVCLFVHSYFLPSR